MAADSKANGKKPGTTSWLILPVISYQGIVAGGLFRLNFSIHQNYLVLCVIQVLGSRNYFQSFYSLHECRRSLSLSRTASRWLAT